MNDLPKIRPEWVPEAYRVEKPVDTSLQPGKAKVFSTPNGFSRMEKKELPIMGFTRRGGQIK